MLLLQKMPESRTADFYTITLPGDLNYMNKLPYVLRLNYRGFPGNWTLNWANLGKKNVRVKTEKNRNKKILTNKTSRLNLNQKSKKIYLDFICCCFVTCFCKPYFLLCKIYLHSVGKSSYFLNKQSFLFSFLLQ